MLDPAPLQFAKLSPDEEDSGLRLALMGLAEAEINQQVGMLRAWVERQPLCGYQVWGAFRAENLTGALLVQTQPGRTAVISQPRLVAGEAQETAGQILRRYLESLSPQEVCMVQAVLPTDAVADTALLLSAGFHHLSDLLYLVCLSNDFPVNPPSPELQFEPYTPTLHSRFAQLVDATYEETRDCPAVNGVRCVDDVLEGYRSTGQFDPQRWFLVRHRGEEFGCLILTDYPEHSTWELIYLGIVPKARGRGRGVEMVRHALWLCGQASRTRLVLAVDAANEPALRVYAAAGFQSWDRRSVYIRVLGGSGMMKR